MQLTAAAAILLCCVVLSSGMKDAAAASSDDDSAVTFGSVIKLRHKSTGAYLHSHKVAWGSGSKQQSVTAMAADDDRNSYWVVKEGNDEAGKSLGMCLHASVCECVFRVIKCQVLDTCDRGAAAFAAMHLHYVLSSLLETNHTGTPVECGSRIRLEHVTTNRNLHSHLFTAALSGQQEVSCFGNTGQGDRGVLQCCCSAARWKGTANVIR